MRRDVSALVHERGGTDKGASALEAWSASHLTAHICTSPDILWGCRADSGQGFVYSGQIEKGQMHGKGTLVYPNGEKYEGDWQWGKRHGFGRMIFPDGSRYTGEWVDDRVHGQGEHVYANGNRYKGEWLDGSITGQGVLTFADGER